MNEPTLDVIENFLGLFAGRTDVYAIRWEWGKDGKAKSIYVPSTYEGDSDHTREHVKETVSSIGTTGYGMEAATAHMKGEHFLGVYPIHADSTVKWFALDFDKDREEAWKAALRQHEIFRDEAGIETFIERSRSGNGYHLWGFLDGPVNAGVLRHALAQFIEEQATYDRMFPNQDGVTDACPLGNLIALPLFGPLAREGKGVFVRVGSGGSPEELDDQFGFLGQVSGANRISSSKIQELSDSAPEPLPPERTIETVRTGPAEEGIKGSYKVVHEELGCEWIRWCWNQPDEVSEPEWYALACQLAQLEGGRDLFHEFSARDEVRYDPSATNAKFDHAVQQNAPHTCEYIRENLNGPRCSCDLRYPRRVRHPYDLAKVPFAELLKDMKLSKGATTLSSSLPRVIDWARALYRNPEEFQGYPYGIPSMDAKTSLRSDDLIIVAARPGIGKSALMNHVALHNAALGNNVYIFSLEMTEEQLTRRMAVTLAEVDATQLFTGNLGFREWRRLFKTMERPLPIWVDDATYDSESIINKAAELIGEHGPGIVMVDYLQFVEGRPGESMYEKNSRVPNELKRLAKALHVPVFVLAQMNREADKASADSTTFDSWLEGSGKIEQAADVVIFMLGKKEPGTVERRLVIHKERHREAHHRVSVDFEQPFMRFKEPGIVQWRRQQIGAGTWLGSSHSAA